MKRDIEQDLLRWKDQPNRMPLILRGARQVGKSFIVEKFGREHFHSCIVINFEQRPEYRRCFETLDPLRILKTMELMVGLDIIPGQTLLFLDEIQECPQAITALRYFKEQLPALHVIGAGSLLEFALNDADFRMPVGRVQFMYLRPLSFGEFLEASGNSKLRSYVQTFQIGDVMEEPIHLRLLELVREYFALGGMPAVVAHYFQTKSLLQCQEIQSALLMTFRNDFGKYALRIQHELLQTVYEKAPGLVAQWLKYSKLDPDTPAHTVKKAIQKLAYAGVLSLVYATSAAGLPLVTHMNEKKFKLLFLDIGLLKRACNLDLELLFSQDLLLLNAGAMAEQFVGQELLAYTAKDDSNRLFFWVREQRNSSAEVDYIVPIDSTIIPIEVKAGSTGTLRSLKIFMDERYAPLGVRISQLPLSLVDQVLSIPFYMVSELFRLVRSTAHP